MSSALIAFELEPGELSNEQLARLCTEFAARLQQVHPLLAEIGLTGKKSTFNSWLEAPLVSSVSLEAWNEIFDAQRRKNGSVILPFWNRRSVEDGLFKYTVYAFGKHDGNRLTVDELPEPLNNAACVSRVLTTGVEAFGAISAEVFTLLHRSDPSGWEVRHWQVWLREGRPWPPAGRRFQESQGAYSSAEPWLGGTLYTWPEYEPWTYHPAGSAA